MKITRKRFILAALALATSAPAQVANHTPDEWRTPYAALLTKYTQPNGVRYAAWKATKEDIEAISAVTKAIGETTIPADKTASLAFYLDAYNAWMLQLMLEAYPTKGPLSTDPDFFKKERIRVAGKKMSLDYLENQIIRTQYSEPRIHFALNCASRSCPPLRSTPYSAGNLEASLSEQTTAYLNDPAAVSEQDSKLVLSQIFEWFGGDFVKKSGSIPAFINGFRKEPLKATKLVFRPYDWSLNEVK